MPIGTAESSEPKPEVLTPRIGSGGQQGIWQEPQIHFGSNWLMAKLMAKTGKSSTSARRAMKLGFMDSGLSDVGFINDDEFASSTSHRRHLWQPGSVQTWTIRLVIRPLGCLFPRIWGLCSVESSCRQGFQRMKGTEFQGHLHHFSECGAGFAGV